MPTLGQLGIYVEGKGEGYGWYWSSTCSYRDLPLILQIRLNGSGDGLYVENKCIREGGTYYQMPIRPVAEKP